MKKIYLLLLMALFTNLSLVSQEIINFEDDKFKNALLSQNPKIDADRDGKISKEEAENFKGALNLKEKNIKSLKGIEYFINITTLDCGKNLLTGELDVSKNTALTYLNVEKNKLTKLEVLGNTFLTSLNVSCNELTKLDVSKNIVLTDLNVHKNLLTELDVSKNTALTSLNVRFNKLTELGVSKNTALISLNTGCNQLTELDVSKNIALTNLYIGTVNYCGNELTELNVSKNIALMNLNVRFNKLTNLDVSKNTALVFLDIKNNKLTNLDVSKNTALTSLNVSQNRLSNLDVSKQTALGSLDVAGNQLTHLDVSKHTDLGFLDVGYNQLTHLDVSENTALRTLHVYNNKLTNLDVSKHIDLNRLSAGGNPLTILDLSKCKLREIHLQYCHELTTLNLIGQQLTFGFFVKDNPKLEMVCANLDKIDFIDSKLKDNNNGDYKVSTDCTKETLNSITGKVTYAQNLGLCGTPNLNPFNKLEIVMSNAGGTKIKVIPNAIGHYSTFVPKGKYYINFFIDKENNFDYTPNDPDNPMMSLINFRGEGETISKDICVIPKDKLDDLSVSITGGEARPGRNITYEIKYENIGNTILSGTVNLKIKEPKKQTFSGASTKPTSKVLDNLSWDFKGLAPFESKTIHVTFKLNKPTDIPELNGGEELSYVTTITDTNGVEKKETIDDNTANLCQLVKNSWDPNDKTCIEGRILRPKNVGKYLTYMIRFENKGTAEAIDIRVEDIIDPTKFDIKSLRYISSGKHLCITEVKGDTVNFNFKDINLDFNPRNNKGYVLFKIKTLESLKEGDEIKNKASIYFDFNKPVITETETVVVKKKVEKEVQFSDYFTLAPNPVKTHANLIEKKSGIKIKFFTINDSVGNMIAFDPGTTRHFDFWYLTSGKIYYLRVFTENNGILSTRFIKE